MIVYNLERNFHNCLRNTYFGMKLDWLMSFSTSSHHHYRELKMDGCGANKVVFFMSHFISANHLAWMNLLKGDTRFGGSQG